MAGDLMIATMILDQWIDMVDQGVVVTVLEVVISRVMGVVLLEIVMVATGLALILVNDLGVSLINYEVLRFVAMNKVKLVFL